MSRELADEIERLRNAELFAEGEHAALSRKLHWNIGTEAEYDQLSRLRSRSVETSGRAAAYMVEHIDVILAALRAPRPAEPEAVEAVARAVYEGLWGHRAKWDDMFSLERAECLALGRAALAALPQPASDMQPATDAASDRNRPAAGGPVVALVEMEDWSQGYAQPAPPVWRVELAGCVADFEHEQAARNWASAIVDYAVFATGEARAEVERADG